MAEALGTVHARGRGLLRGWWWPVCLKLNFDQIAVPVPKNMVVFVCVCRLTFDKNSKTRFFSLLTFMFSVAINNKIYVGHIGDVY
jgi:hypothetical protein